MIQIIFAVSDILIIDNVTSEIRLMKELDRELDTNLIKLDVKCDINFMERNVNFVKEGMIEIHVIDVNDNPPMFHDAFTQQINAGKSVSIPPPYDYFLWQILLQLFLWSSPQSSCFHFKKIIILCK